MRRVIIFDLDDTLTESKTGISEEMSRLIHALLCKYDVGIISGCSYVQLKKQVIDPMCNYAEQNNAWDKEVCISSAQEHLYLMPSSGSQMYFFHDSWCQAYKEELTLKQKVEIFNLFYDACNKSGIMPIEQPYGEIAEDRDGQITFSFLGQHAPLEVKKSWDPDQKKRLAVAQYMKNLCKGLYEITVGGASSMDVTLAGMDKAYGIQKFLDFEIIPLKYKYKKENVVFVADAIFPGGNDYSVTGMGIECVLVKNPAETAEFTKKLLKG